MTGRKDQAQSGDWHELAGMNQEADCKPLFFGEGDHLEGEDSADLKHSDIAGRRG